MRVDIPAAMRSNAVGAWGDAGERWLARLPTLVRELTQAWGLQILGPAGPFTLHWVASAIRDDGTPVVLKLGPTVPGHLAHEALALQAFAGRGAVRLLAHDPERGALLLERAAPGTPVTGLVRQDDAAATEVLVDVVRRLHRAPVPAGLALPDLVAQGESLRRHLTAHRGDDVLPRRWVQRAAGLLGDLCSSAPRTVVLHGDLHHDNVLRATREPWLAIDPHGVLGDPGYELGATLYNPRPTHRDPELLALVGARIEQLAEGLVMAPERVAAWGFVKAVLSEAWSHEDGATARSRAFDVADLLWPRLP